jgi:hypothetical protein
VLQLQLFVVSTKLAGSWPISAFVLLIDQARGRLETALLLTSLPFISY